MKGTNKKLPCVFRAAGPSMASPLAFQRLSVWLYLSRVARTCCANITIRFVLDMGAPLGWIGRRTCILKSTQEPSNTFMSRMLYRFVSLENHQLHDRHLWLCDKSWELLLLKHSTNLNRCTSIQMNIFNCLCKVTSCCVNLRKFM